MSTISEKLKTDLNKKTKCHKIKIETYKNMLYINSDCVCVHVYTTTIDLISVRKIYEITRSIGR